MNIKRQDLEAAVNVGILNNNQVDPLLKFLHQQEATSGKPKFSGTHVLYYLGGMLAICAVTIFTTLSIDTFGMPALFCFSVLYIVFSIFAAIFFEKRKFLIPSGIFATLAIALVPLAVFALQHILGAWNDGEGVIYYRDYHSIIDSRWLIMELFTLFFGILMLIRFRYPFMMLPLAVTLCYMGMDIIPSLMHKFQNKYDFWSGSSWQIRKTISLVYGILLLILAFIVDIRTRWSKDFAYWLYIFGLLSFWGALTFIDSTQLINKIIYLGINIILIFIGAILGRRVFAVFGGIGIIIELGVLSSNLFQNPFYFGFTLTALGGIFILMGILWNKYEKNISTRLRAKLPKSIRELLEIRKN